MSRAPLAALAFAGGALLGRFGAPPALGWGGVLPTRETLWGIALACGAALTTAALTLPPGRGRRFVVSLALGGFLFVPLLFAGFLGVMALGERVVMEPATLSTLSVVSPASAYLGVAGFVLWRTAKGRHA